LSGLNWIIIYEVLNGFFINMLTKEYNALLYKNNSADGKPVTLGLEKYSLKIKTENENISLPISGIEFKLGGEESSFLIAKGKDIILYIRDTDIFDELILNSNPAQVEILNRLKSSLRLKKGNRRLLPVYVLASISGFILLVYLSFQIFTDLIARSIPVSWEKKIGDAALSSMTYGKTVHDPVLVKPVKEIGEYLASKGNNPQYEFKFYVIDNNELNAFALPGGNVVVHSGLLKYSDSPEEVAGVLAHEINHVYGKHGMKRIVKRFGLSIFLSLIFGSLGGQLDAIGGDLASLKFDRDEESEADQKGLELLYNAGVDPNGMVKFFKKLQERDKDLPEVLSFFSTHPSTATRITDLQNLINSKYKKLPFKKDFKIDWKKVKLAAEKI
jgi:Zn-dependent protease with chaperone function